MRSPRFLDVRCYHNIEVETANVPIFSEAFLIPVLVAIAGEVILSFILKWGWRRRIYVLVAICSLAYVISYTLGHTGSTGQTSQNPASTAAPRISGDATTYGNDSPAVTGDRNQITYGESAKPGAKSRK